MLKPSLYSTQLDTQTVEGLTENACKSSNWPSVSSVTNLSTTVSDTT